MKSTPTILAATPTQKTGFSLGDWVRTLLVVVVGAVALYVATEPKLAGRLMAWPQQAVAGLFGPDKSEIEAAVLSRIQGNIDAGTEDDRGLKVGSVMLLETGRNAYRGMVTMMSPDGSECGSFTIEVIVDGTRMMMQPGNQMGMLGCMKR